MPSKIYFRTECPRQGHTVLMPDAVCPVSRDQAMQIDHRSKSFGHVTCGGHAAIGGSPADIDQIIASAREKREITLKSKSPYFRFNALD
ncbi:hypothetical protein RRG08_008511 [Elysia crispata]|uniref:Uncharacterized protein n=1 Tax=Elysia crispata TaxID=231223 RepID=A0AAE0Z8B0_9GAST|nr:hypothetical protein RRG08_008511 [Elysia crispata]